MDSRVAVVGCGSWGRNLVRNLERLGALELLCDTNEASLAGAPAARTVRRTTSFEDVLRDEVADAVVIATPAASHYEHARAALLAGKHVFVEKPLALHYQEGVELARLAESTGRTLMVGHILEYHPAVVLLKQLVRDGELGRIWYVYSNRLNLGRVRLEENILWSFAPHDISVISSLVGAEPLVASSIGGNYLQHGIADVTVTNLLFENDVRAHIFVSWLHPYKEQKLVVVGDRKMAVFDDTAKDNKLRIFDKGIEWRDGVPVPRQTSESTLFFDPAEPLAQECAHFLECVRTGAAPVTGAANGLRVLRVLEASQRSLELGGVPVNVARQEQDVLP